MRTWGRSMLWIAGVRLELDGGSALSAFGGKVVVFNHASMLEQGTPVYEFNVSSPPTAAELDAGIGAAANLPPGFEAFVDDTGAGVTVWKVGVVAGAWWYEQRTKAV